MSAKSRRLAEQARRNAEAEAAIDADMDRITQDAERQYQLGASSAAEELRAGLMAAQSGTENAEVLAAAFRARRRRGTAGDERQEGQR